MSEKPRRAAAPDPSRLVAAQVLCQVAEKDAFSNLVLPKALRVEQQKNPNFDFRDAAFTSELVYGTIRQQGYLDAILAKFSSRPLSELDVAVLQILRMGAYQLFFMRVPDHAAVGETVDVARHLTTDGPVRMVNAILRSITRATPEQIEDIFAEITDPSANLAARLSHPKWVVDAFDAALSERGYPPTDLAAALEANNQTPQVTLVARPGLTTAADLAEEAEAVLQTSTRQGEISEFAVIIGGGNPASLSSLRAGTSAVQDEGSQLAALLLAEAPIYGTDRRWLDLCAGPGGKSALLGAVAKERGAHVLANEISPHRARLVKKSVQALDNVTVVTSDGRDFAMPSEGAFDRVLIDAPCTGLGSLRRRPESRWRHVEADIDELVSLQRELLRRGIELTRPGGVVAWVTCTPVVAETIDQIDYALSLGNVELMDTVSLAQKQVVVDLDIPEVPTNISGRRAQILRSTLQLWPHRHGTDAMFVALMRKLS